MLPAISPFNITDMQSYVNYTATKNTINVGISNQVAAKKGMMNKISTDDAKIIANNAVNDVTKEAGKTIEELSGIIQALRTPNVEEVDLKDGGKKIITSCKDGQEIEYTDKDDKTTKIETTLADGTKTVIEHEDGKPAKKFTKDPDGTNQAPIHYDAQGNEREGDPIAATTVTSVVNQGNKSYKQTEETLTDGTTRVTLKSQLDDEYFCATGKIGVDSGLRKLVDVTQEEYSNPEKGLKISTKDNVTTITDDKKGVDITITAGEPSFQWADSPRPMTIEYKYREGEIESATIKGIYKKFNYDGWVLANDAIETVKFRNNDTATIKYRNDGGIPEVDGKIAHQFADGAQRADVASCNAVYNPLEKADRLAHVCPTYRHSEKSYAAPLSSDYIYLGGV